MCTRGPVKFGMRTSIRSPTTIVPSPMSLESNGCVVGLCVHNRRREAIEIPTHLPMTCPPFVHTACHFPAQLNTFTSTRFHNPGCSGSLPVDWGRPNAFPQLRTLDLSKNPGLTGSLPDTWGLSSAFPTLEQLRLHNCSLGGELPAAWGLVGGLDSLVTVTLQGNQLEGSVPAEWSQRVDFGAPLLTLVVKPGNDRLCGDAPRGVVLVSEDLVDAEVEGGGPVAKRVPDGFFSAGVLLVSLANEPASAAARGLTSSVSVEGGTNGGSQAIVVTNGGRSQSLNVVGGGGSGGDGTESGATRSGSGRAPVNTQNSNAVQLPLCSEISGAALGG